MIGSYYFKALTCFTVFVGDDVDSCHKKYYQSGFVSSRACRLYVPRFLSEKAPHNNIK